MPDRKDERQSDPRSLSEKSPGRSKNQDDVPPMPSPAFTEKKHQEEKARTVTPSPPDPGDLERRDARAHSALPFGTKGSRKGRPVGGTAAPEDGARRS